ncbi:hypothetical protein HWV62_38316 [Athelia sp. TMB]|nr:hypothetical protein HWV62_38316 [Athelia sp. TMB]
MSPSIIFLRAPSHIDDSPDPYESAFKEVDFTTISVPVLETAFTNVIDFRACIARGPQGLAGVIITSARSCEAWANALSGIETTGAVLLPSFCRQIEKMKGDWSTIPFYVVGAATHKALSSIPGEKSIRGGAQTGTSESLARFILDDLPQDKAAKRTLLYLTGDKNRDTLPAILAEGNIDLHSLKVYETRGSSNFAGDLKDAVGKIPMETLHWIVFFAPSAAEFVTPILRRFFHLPANGPPSQEALQTRKAKLAAIGPTTRDFLMNTLALRVTATPLKPNPQSLVEAILNDTS